MLIKFKLTYKKEGGVHDCGAVQHGGHEDVVAGAVDEADVPDQLVLEAVHHEGVLLAGAHRGVAHGSLAPLVPRPVDLGVGVAKLDGDVSLQLVLESDGLHPREGLHHGRLSVGHVADRADVDGGLAGYDLGREGRQLLDVDAVQVLLCQVRLTRGHTGKLFFLGHGVELISLICRLLICRSLSGLVLGLHVMNMCFKWCTFKTETRPIEKD